MAPRLSIALVCTGLWTGLWASVASADPTAYSGLVLWLDGSDVNGDGTNPANGTTVGLWSDKSGLANHALSSGGSPPLYDANAIGSNGAIDCGVTNDEMLSTSITSDFATTEATILIVANGVNDLVHVSISDAAGPDPLEHEFLVYDHAIYHHSAMNTYVYKPHQDAPTGFYIQAAVFGAFPTDLSNWINGHASNLPVQPGPIAPFLYPPVSRAASICDRSGQLFNENFDGKIAEVIVYSRKLLTGERRDLEAYLSAKYAISLGTPVPGLGPLGLGIAAIALVAASHKRLVERHRPCR